MSPFRTVGRLAAIASLAVLAACSGTDTGTGPSTSAAKGGGGTPPGFYSGTWLQTPPTRSLLLGYGASGTDTLFTDLTLHLNLVQSGTKLSGSVSRYITTWDNHGVFLYRDVDAGSPGKVSGTVTGTTLAVLVSGLGETKINVRYPLVASADGRTLVNQAPTPTTPAAFTR